MNLINSETDRDLFETYALVGGQLLVFHCMHGHFLTAG